jgi:hypothetical protein
MIKHSTILEEYIKNLPLRFAWIFEHSRKEYFLPKNRELLKFLGNYPELYENRHDLHVFFWYYFQEIRIFNTKNQNKSIDESYDIQERLELARFLKESNPIEIKFYSLTEPVSISSKEYINELTEHLQDYIRNDVYPLDYMSFNTYDSYVRAFDLCVEYGLSIDIEKPVPEEDWENHRRLFKDKKSLRGNLAEQFYTLYKYLRKETCFEKSTLKETRKFVIEFTSKIGLNWTDITPTIDKTEYLKGVFRRIEH